MDNDDATLITNRWWSKDHTARRYVVRGVIDELGDL